MRASGWIPFIERLVSEGSTPRADGTHLRLFGNNGEQDVYNLAVIKHPLRSAIVYQFPCRWNVQLIGGSLCLACVATLPRHIVNVQVGRVRVLDLQLHQRVDYERAPLNHAVDESVHGVTELVLTAVDIDGLPRGA